MPQTPPDPSYSLDELAALAGLTRRTVRYYIQLGLVGRPIGETRAAYYTADHLEQLLAVVKFSNHGLSLDRIAQLLRGPPMPPPAEPPRVGTVEVRSHLTLAEGVELVIEPGRAELTPGQVRRLFQEALALYAKIAEESDDER
jgi:DNA-binding transcriptional MerR regulator